LETRRGFLSSQNAMNFGPLTVKNWTGVFTHPPKIMGFSQLNGKFNGLYLRNETRHRQPGNCVGNYEGSATSSQNDMNFGPQFKHLKIRPEFLPTLRKFCVFYCRASHTYFRPQDSTKLCHTVGVNHDNKLPLK